MLGKVSQTSTIETDQSNFYHAYGGVRQSLQTENPQRAMRDLKSTNQKIRLIQRNEPSR